jgi:transcriptional regulator with XRE-family HTH domain
MDENHKPIYGFMQYPLKNYPQLDNSSMDITKIIAANLDAWMASSTNLTTIKKVSARAGVGFGTVQRARLGDGSITVKNLADIARAFHRSPIDLLQTDQPYALSDKVINMSVREAPVAPLITELLAVAERMNDRGIAELIGRAKELAAQHPKAKANHAN